MRTVANGLISQPLIDTQKDASRTPYIDITIDGTNYWSRLEYLEYHEEAYRDRAIIGLNNRDRTLDTLDLDGMEFAIKLGYDTSANGGTTTDTVTYPTLWVKSHQIISDMGQCIYQIYAEGCWSYLIEQTVIAGVTGWKASTAYVVDQIMTPSTPNSHQYKCTTAGTSGATEPIWMYTTGTVGTTVFDGTVVWSDDGIAQPYSSIFNRTHTVEGLIKLIIEGMGWTWTAVTSSDGLIDVFKPVLEVNQMGFENARALIYRLIMMTKSYLRQRAGKVFMAVYPQTTDAVDETYYSYQPDWFIEYVEQTILLIPNSIVVLCNLDPDTREWTTAFPRIIGTAEDAAAILKYDTVIRQYLVGSINNQVDADGRADAIITRLKAEILGGRLVSPHDCRVELYDRVSVVDTRGI